MVWLLTVCAVFGLPYAAMALNERPTLSVRSWTGLLLVASAAVLMVDSGMWAYYIFWASYW